MRFLGILMILVAACFYAEVYNNFFSFHFNSLLPRSFLIDSFTQRCLGNELIDLKILMLYFINIYRKEKNYDCILLGLFELMFEFLSLKAYSFKNFYKNFFKTLITPFINLL